MANRAIRRFGIQGLAQAGRVELPNLTVIEKKVSILAVNGVSPADGIRDDIPRAAGDGRAHKGGETRRVLSGSHHVAISAKQRPGEVGVRPEEVTHGIVLVCRIEKSAIGIIVPGSGDVERVWPAGIVSRVGQYFWRFQLV